MPRTALLITAEHAGRRVPRAHAGLFRGSLRTLASHRGWDPGSLELARELSRAFRAPLVAATVTRLLIDVNRSLDNPSLFSAWTRGLAPEERARIIARYYTPHRSAVERAIRRLLRAHDRVIHVGVHSFAPVLRGERRTMDLGLLFDPARALERRACRAWASALARADPRLRIALNAPYRGIDDGLTTHLRAVFPPSRYAGIELEVNQRFPRRGGARWRAVRRAIIASLGEAPDLPKR